MKCARPKKRSATYRLGGMPGGMLTLSSNGKNPNTGIVWALAPVDRDANNDVVEGIARAYDATDLDPTPIDPQTPPVETVMGQHTFGGEIQPCEIQSSRCRRWTAVCADL